jgi:beta-N-acetylhexosaminidase
VFRARVRESAERVVRTKLRYLKAENAAPVLPDPRTAASGIPSQDGARFFQDLAARAVTVLKDGAGLIPLAQEKAGRVFLPGQSMSFFELGKKAFRGASAYWYSTANDADLLRRAAASDTIILHLSGEEGVQVLRALRPLGKRIIVLFVRSPAYLEQVPWVDAAIAVYSDSNESLVAGFSALTGRLKAQGTRPFR